MGTVQVKALCYTCRNYYQYDDECACGNFLEIGRAHVNSSHESESRIPACACK